MNQKYESTGYDLYNPFENQWVIDLKNGQAYYGTFKEVSNYMISKFNFFIEDIESAVDILVQKNHNACHFGCYKTFIYSFDKEINVLQKAS